jgi:nitroreductase
MDFFDVVLHQRACRSFADRPVDETLIAQCLEAAVHAPSAENLQPWVFVIVRDAEKRDAIDRLNKKAWDDGVRAYAQSRYGPMFLREITEGMEGGMSKAPVIVMVCGEGPNGPDATLLGSIYPAIQNLLLAASALGLGSAVTTLATMFDKELRELLALPDGLFPIAIVPLGWPARPLGTPRRRPLSERAHWDQYGTPW